MRNIVKTHHLAKSISDVAWTLFRDWLEYFGRVFGVPVIAVPPHNTSQDCSNCGLKVEKTLSTRTHKCPHCNYIQDRDWNAAINILKKALQLLSESTVGHTEAEACGAGSPDRVLCPATPLERMTSALLGKPKSVSRLAETGNLNSNI